MDAPVLFIRWKKTFFKVYILALIIFHDIQVQVNTNMKKIETGNE